jgi:hypothetical protein
MNTVSVSTLLNGKPDPVALAAIDPADRER